MFHQSQADSLVRQTAPGFLEAASAIMPSLEEIVHEYES